MLGFPEHDFDDGQAGLAGVLVDEPGDVLGRRVAVHHEDALAVLQEHGQDRVVTAEQHVVIQVLVDPLLHGLLDVAEIDEHPSRVELRALESDDCTAVVPVQMTAFSVVVEQAVAVTKLDLARDSKHDGLWLVSLASPEVIG